MQCHVIHIWQFADFESPVFFLLLAKSHLYKLFHVCIHNLPSSIETDADKDL